MKVTGFDYTPGHLTFRFEPIPHPNWMAALHGLQNSQSFPGLAEPARVELKSNGHGKVGANEQTAVPTTKMVRQWVKSANGEYRRELRQKAEAEERRRRDELVRRQQELEEVTRVRRLLQQSSQH